MAEKYKISKKDFYSWLKENQEEYDILMAYYRCAMMEITTKFQVLNEAMSLRYERRNPIETIKNRLKTFESIRGKLERKHLELTIENIERGLNDVAGIRVICSFPMDIYMMADSLSRQDDLIIIERKDYMQNPKASGYRSLHLIVAVPIFLHDHKKMMTVEVQFRTIGMDWWATLEHKIKYKKNLPHLPQVEASLIHCAQTSYQLDLEMQELYKTAMEAAEKAEAAALEKENGGKQTK